MIVYSNCCTILDNSIEYNNYNGIYLRGSNNTIIKNSITNNAIYGLEIEFGSSESRFNLIYYNNFSRNGINAHDGGVDNKWDDGFVGNYWDDCIGNDTKPIDGIINSIYLISGSSRDTKPFLYPMNSDTDGDGLSNYEEYTLGNDNYRTNVTNSDSDYDGLSDYWEWGNSTNPWEPDTDFDNMPDGWEVFNLLDPLYGLDNLTDADNDLLLNLYEYHNGTDPQNPDSDFDNMPDGWEVFNSLDPLSDDAFNDSDNDQLENLYEFLNGTDPQNADSDSDNMPDGWEVFNSLDPLSDDAFNDSDNDLLLNIYEYLNGTDPNNDDTDGDTFLDGKEVELNTKPLNRWWYPMPNLEILDFKAKAANINEPFTLNFTIINNGIWRAEDVVIRIKIEYGNLTLWDNFNDPIDLEVDETYQDLIQITGVTTSGGLVMLLELDPLHSINETYSSKDGSMREDAENNLLKTELQIERTQGEFDLIWIILIIIGAVAFAGVISSYVILRPKIKTRAVLKRQIKLAKTDIENFKFNLRNFIKIELKDIYNDNWWEKGIPDYIKNSIENMILALKSKKSQIPIEKSDFFDFIHYTSIITTDNNWELTFSKTFPNKRIVEENFENLRMFERNINEGIVRPEELTNYPLYIHTIRNYFMRGFNIFLSYSTLDADHFQIHEVAKRLESYPRIDKVFFWEADSGENIVTYMERTLRISNVFVLFCSENASRSKAVEDEWQAAFQLRKSGKMKIVPVYEKEGLIPYLLMPLLNVKFTRDDFDAFINNFYEEILRQ
jgi:parallel beta-helix repeat protein